MWWRRKDAPLIDLVLDPEVQYLRHPEGVLEVRSGQTSYGATVYATTHEPRRWFYNFRGASVPDGSWAMILWEVDPSIGQRALSSRGRDSPDRSLILGVTGEVMITRTRDGGASADSAGAGR